MISRTEFVVHGAVQGVFFRDFARREAQRCGLVGFVENVSDGTVRISAEGEDGALVSFARSVRKGPIGAAVARVDETRMLPPEGYADFQTR